MEGQKPTPLPRVPSTPQARVPNSTQPIGVGFPGERSLYARLGGKAAITRVVDDFVKEVVADDRIHPEHKKHFREGDVAGLKTKLVNQIGMATGGPEKDDSDMKQAPKGLKITNADFDALVNDLVRAMRKNAVPEKEQQAVTRLLEPFRKEIVEIR
jgi:hemoglobin